MPPTFNMAEELIATQMPAVQETGAAAVRLGEQAAQLLKDSVQGKNAVQWSLPEGYSLDSFPMLQKWHSNGRLGSSFVKGRVPRFAVDSFVRNVNATVQTKSCGGLWSGSGFFIGENGLGVTNYHVERSGGGLFDVITANGRKLEAGLVARNKIADVSLFQIIEPNQKFATVEMVPQNWRQTSADLYALGHPLSSEEITFSKTAGATLNLEGHEVALRRLGSYGTFKDYLPELIDPSRRPPGSIFHAVTHNVLSDLPIMRGSSGSGLFDSSGRLVGVLKAGNSDDGTPLVDVRSLATHASHVDAMLKEIPRGRALHGWFDMLTRAEYDTVGRPTATVIKSKLVPWTQAAPFDVTAEA